jgi:hypothetical protein
MRKIAATLSQTVIIMPPGANQPNEGIQKGAMMLSAVAAAVPDLSFVRSYDAHCEWHTILLEGTIDGTTVQFIDQIHIDQNGLADHIDIFLRPATLAPVLLAKVTAGIQSRIAAN